MKNLPRVDLYSMFIFLLPFLLFSSLVDQSLGAPAVEGDDVDGGCYYMFNHYGEGDRIFTNEPCLNCTCHNSMLMCYLRVCPFTKPIGQDCTIEKKPDQCCPVISCPEVPVSLVTPSSLTTTTVSTTSLATVSELSTELAHYERGCNIEGKFYPDGAQVEGDPTKPCELCYCIRNKTACVMQECILHVEGCQPVFQPTVCCPVRYRCDYLALPDETTVAGLITTTVKSIFTSTPVPGGCVREGEYYADGSQIPGATGPCEHCYCMRGEIVCAVQECGAPLENEGGNCTAIAPPPGMCCPEKYSCDGETVSDDVDSTTVSTSQEAAVNVTQQTLSEAQPSQEPVVEGTTVSSGSGVDESTVPSIQDVEQPTTISPAVDDDQNAISSTEASSPKPSHAPEESSPESIPTVTEPAPQDDDNSIDATTETPVATESPKDSVLLSTDLASQGLQLPHGILDQTTEVPVATTMAPSSGTSLEDSTVSDTHDDEDKVADSTEGPPILQLGGVITTIHPHPQTSSEADNLVTSSTENVLVVSQPPKSTEGPLDTDDVGTTEKSTSESSESSSSEKAEVTTLASSTSESDEGSDEPISTGGVESSTESSSKIPFEGDRETQATSTEQPSGMSVEPSTDLPVPVADSVYGHDDESGMKDHVADLEETTSKPDAEKNEPAETTIRPDAEKVSDDKPVNSLSPSNDQTEGKKEEPTTMSPVLTGEVGPDTVTSTKVPETESSTSSPTSDDKLEESAPTTVASISHDEPVDVTSAPVPVSDSDSSTSSPTPEAAVTEGIVSEKVADGPVHVIPSGTQETATEAVVGDEGKVTSLPPIMMGDGEVIGEIHVSSTPEPAESLSMHSTSTTTTMASLLPAGSEAENEIGDAHDKLSDDASPSSPPEIDPHPTSREPETVNSSTQESSPQPPSGDTEGDTQPGQSVTEKDEKAVQAVEKVTEQPHSVAAPGETIDQDEETVAGTTSPPHSSSESGVSTEAPKVTEATPTEVPDAGPTEIPASSTDGSVPSGGPVVMSTKVFLAGATEQPEVVPTDSPAASPTEQPEVVPTDHPVASPTEQPEVVPNDSPAASPTEQPEVVPTDSPAASPTEQPEVVPTDSPAASPTEQPEVVPTDSSAASPTEQPQVVPTDSPAPSPTEQPEVVPTGSPAPNPTEQPEAVPTDSPAASPTEQPEVIPIDSPSASPTEKPEVDLSDSPVDSPTEQSEAAPTDSPAASPTEIPATVPTVVPSAGPTELPSLSSSSAESSTISPVSSSSTPEINEPHPTSSEPSPPEQPGTGEGSPAPPIDTETSTQLPSAEDEDVPSFDKGSEPVSEVTTQLPTSEQHDSFNVTKLEEAPEIAKTTISPVVGGEDGDSTTSPEVKPDDIPVTTGAPIHHPPTDSDTSLQDNTVTEKVDVLDESDTASQQPPGTGEAEISPTQPPPQQDDVTTVRTSSVADTTPDTQVSKVQPTELPETVTVVPSVVLSPSEDHDGQTTPTSAEHEVNTTTPSKTVDTIDDQAQQEVQQHDGESPVTTIAPVPADSVPEGSMGAEDSNTTVAPESSIVPQEQVTDKPTTVIKQDDDSSTSVPTASSTTGSGGATDVPEEVATTTSPEKDVTEKPSVSEILKPQDTPISVQDQDEKIVTTAQSPSSDDEAAAVTTSSSSQQEEPTVTTSSPIQDAVQVPKSPESETHPLSSSSSSSPTDVEIPVTTELPQTTSRPDSDSGDEDNLLSQGLKPTHDESVSQEEEAHADSPTTVPTGEENVTEPGKIVDSDMKSSTTTGKPTEASSEASISTTVGSVSDVGIGVTVYPPTSPEVSDMKDVDMEEKVGHEVPASSQEEEPHVPGEGHCFVEGKTYKNGSSIPPTTPCHIVCACQNSIVHCLLVHCNPPPSDTGDCKPIYKQGVCCPTYDCEDSQDPTVQPTYVTPGPVVVNETNVVTVTPETPSGETSESSGDDKHVSPGTEDEHTTLGAVASDEAGESGSSQEDSQGEKSTDVIEDSHSPLTPTTTVSSLIHNASTPVPDVPLSFINATGEGVSVVHESSETPPSDIPSSSPSADVEGILGNEHNATSQEVFPPGSLYPVTTTTTVTPSSAPWPYPSSTPSPSAMTAGACLFDGRVYMSAQQIPRDDPCDFCFCFRGDIICLQQSCPPPIPGCYEEPIPGFCCPRYECPVGNGNVTTQTPIFPPSYYHNQILNGMGSGASPGAIAANVPSGPGCEVQGEYYESGQIITSTSGPCLECRCGMTGMMECDPRECQPEPMLRKMIAAITSR